jgi:hypothetical protein
MLLEPVLLRNQTCPEFLASLKPTPLSRSVTSLDLQRVQLTLMFAELSLTLVSSLCIAFLGKWSFRITSPSRVVVVVSCLHFGTCMLYLYITWFGFTLQCLHQMKSIYYLSWSMAGRTWATWLYTLQCFEPRLLGHDQNIGRYSYDQKRHILIIIFRLPMHLETCFPNMPIGTNTTGTRHYADGPELCRRLFVGACYLVMTPEKSCGV